ncbi:ABC transporter ATP-binding protein [Hyperthermus butylicus]|uniref:ABC transporter n=1 Tax=Hyperthermus butylicus (strain DSM 5456 / JCM 9403 / PLM1-5) TaxID=415426 RepID=A2BMX4_HYPBU|nr:ABC transporter ATP-binding protein [Hyperthermus butylicus]ABM81335.1 putative ABC transporter [Hyperthermus butylicus DSM 5456]
MTIAYARNLWKAYRPGEWVLRGVELKVEEGELVVIVGPNGSGKTTLLRILAGLLRPSRGEVRVCGHPPWSLEAKRCRGVVMHHSFLYDELTVAENIELYARLNNASSYVSASDPIVEKLGLRARLSQLAGWLSFGWRRRGDIARALAHKPRLLLIDEPLTGLDPDAAKTLTVMLRGLADSGTAIIAATPKGEPELLGIADKVYEIREGKLLEMGKR